MSQPVNAYSHVDLPFQAARGQAKGWELVLRHGENPSIGSALEEFYHGAGLYPGFDVATAAPVDLVSSDLGDALNGTGAHEYTVYGLDATFARISEVVAAHATAGTTPVSTVASFLRVDRVEVTGAGSNNANLGTITASIDDGGAKTVAIIPIGENITSLGVYTVPKDKRAFPIELWGQTTAADEVHYHFYYRAPGSALWYHSLTVFVKEARTSENLYGFSPVPLTAGYDLSVRAERVAGSGTTPSSAGFALLLAPNLP